MHEKLRMPIAEHFDAPVDSNLHSLLRETAWMGGCLTEGPYLLSMIVGENLFKLPTEEYPNRLRLFAKSRLPSNVVDTFCTFGNQTWLIPWLRRIYHTEVEAPDMPSKNDRLEIAVTYLLEHPQATDLELAKAVGTTVKQIQRISDLFVIRRELRFAEK